MSDNSSSDFGLPPAGTPLRPYLGDPTGGYAAPTESLPRPPAGDDPFAIVGPPAGWLVGTLLLGLAGAVAAALFGESIGIAAAAWFVAGPLGIGLLAGYALQDTSRRARLGYQRSVWIGGLYTVAVVAAAIGIGISAWRIAVWAGRL